MTKPTNSEFKEIFDDIALQYNEISNSYLVSKRKNIFGGWAKGKCLEVGAGTGEISRFLSSQHIVVATDISSRMVEQIKKTGIEAHVCDGEKLPFQNESFETVIASEVLFYFDNPDNFLAEAHRVLKPQGRLLISCASNFPVKFYDRIRSWLRALGVKRGMYFSQDPLREFMTPAKLQLMIKRNNFKVIEMKKSPILPLASFDFLNQILEKTPLRHFGIFIFSFAKKPDLQ